MSPALTQPVHLRVHSCPTQLPVVRAAVEKVCELLGFCPETVGAVVLSVDEALTNIIRHAYGGARDQQIEVDLTPLPDASGGPGLRISLRDYGRQVDAAQIRSRELEDVRPGGLGVHIMSACMDSVEYRPAEGGGTVLVMTKTPGGKKESSRT